MYAEESYCHDVCYHSFNVHEIYFNNGQSNAQIITARASNVLPKFELLSSRFANGNVSRMHNELE